MVSGSVETKTADSLGLASQYINLNALLTNLGVNGNLKVLAVPCNQFGKQEPGASLVEIKNGIKYVRPGGGYVPAFNLTEKMDVNGASENKFFTFVKSRCPPMSHTIGDASYLFWAPIKTTDVQWNFEKFLIDKRGVVRYRIRHRIAPDAPEVTALIAALLNEQ
ncbi:glutathione peroxidase 3-like [Lineus longissimus]|uniref:glutathione peroxidase 3-like n=1 Tax=Lineus longissimus TaxID=88925 RepID=UPI00315C70B4